MNDREALEFIKAIYLRENLSSYEFASLKIAISALQERIDWEKGCYCCETGIYKVNNFIYPQYDLCPKYGRPLKGVQDERD